MTYAVKELFYTLQGEGANAGRPAVFCRFSGCNLWSGREEDRPFAVCRFCDTDFVGTDGTGGRRFEAAGALADNVAAIWPRCSSRKSRPLVVCTGGEPLLQIDEALIEAFHARGFDVAVETNGTKIAPRGIDWICVSPKAGTGLKLRAGDELKLVYPQKGAEPELFENLQFTHFYLQPMDGPERKHNTELAIRFCLENPSWRLSIQTHKILGIR
jgi:7-carboxy-7-deazaguanine synthase